MNLKRGRVLIPVLLFGSLLQAQFHSSRMDPEKLQKHLASFQDKPNAWRAKPFHLQSADDVPPAIRQYRDEFWDEGIGASESLLNTTKDVAKSVAYGDSAFNTPELPLGKNLIWAIGTFTNYRVRLSRSERSIYTEIIFTIEKPLHGAQFFENDHITVTTAGGTIESSSRSIISYCVDPEDIEIEPHKKYLMVLWPHDEGDFYTIQKFWDMTDGTVRPMTPLERGRMAMGKSQLAGKTAEQVADTLAKHYGEKQ